MHTMTDAILEQYKQQAFNDGIAYALDYLSSLYDGVYDTDIAKELEGERESIFSGDNN